MGGVTDMQAESSSCEGHDLHFRHRLGVALHLQLELRDLLEVIQGRLGGGRLGRPHLDGGAQGDIDSEFPQLQAQPLDVCLVLRGGRVLQCSCSGRK